MAKQTEARDAIRQARKAVIDALDALASAMDATAQYERSSPIYKASRSEGKDHLVAAKRMFDTALDE